LAENKKFLYWQSFEKDKKVIAKSDSHARTHIKRKIHYLSHHKPGDIIDNNLFYMAVFEGEELPEYEEEFK